MICWGETDNQRSERKASREIARVDAKERKRDFLSKWHYHFVWGWPVKLLDGRRAWGSNIARRYLKEEMSANPFSDRNIITFEYRPWPEVVREQLENS